ncbi:lysoplasmalogenase [Paludifilum halophilum]|uniref:Lysoplasmalogenase n=1 Tax=Paludifilum halophilum TaxID=1642702 RepID=A0A235B543_9BACL|nr:lysoplasmalogenase [Paludifilum halophilum]OYD07351.1 hypothetical protein CHM34_10600 [Paludifilum halophilum]
MIPSFLSLAVLSVGLCDLYAIFTRKHSWRYAFKPATMLFIIVLAGYGSPDAGTYGWLILIGLLFSLAGDIFLVLPSDRFIQGLLSFLLAHLCYASAFLLSAHWEWKLTLATALPLIAIAVLYTGQLLPGVHRQGGVSLQIAVIAYVLVITLMVWLGLLTQSPWITAGALLFFVSDAVLAWNRFVKDGWWGDPAVMITYFSSQYLLAYSVLVAPNG